MAIIHLNYAHLQYKVDIAQLHVTYHCSYVHLGLAVRFHLLLILRAWYVRRSDKCSTLDVLDMIIDLQRITIDAFTRTLYRSVCVHSELNPSGLKFARLSR